MSAALEIAAAPDLSATARQRFEALVRWTLVEELPAARGFLPEDECRPFLDYYRNLPGPHDEARIRRYLRGLWRS